MSRDGRHHLHLKAAILAGIGAAVLVTAFEVVLWRAFDFPLPDTLFRDARLAAAIVLGDRVLTPPSTFDWRIMIVATCVHFALSILYALILGAAVNALSLRAALVAGALFGLALYAVNMYGFTLLFPWFAITRDPITALAHVVFGVTASAAYVAARRRPEC